MQKIVKKPERPANDDCCGGGGCCPCVWDFYFDQLTLWEEQETTGKAEKEKDTALPMAATTNLFR
ncbi:MAG: oxidoreductase-like domain-containing protein [Cycloclasticus sp.]